jgi:hypothetical protein
MHVQYQTEPPVHFMHGFKIHKQLIEGLEKNRETQEGTVYDNVALLNTFARIHLSTETSFNHETLGLLRHEIFHTLFSRDCLKNTLRNNMC